MASRSSIRVHSGRLLSGRNSSGRPGRAHRHGDPFLTWLAPTPTRKSEGWPCDACSLGGRPRQHCPRAGLVRLFLLLLTHSPPFPPFPRPPRPRRGASPRWRRTIPRLATRAREQLEEEAGQRHLSLRGDPSCTADTCQAEVALPPQAAHAAARPPLQARLSEARRRGGGGAGKEGPLVRRPGSGTLAGPGRPDAPSGPRALTWPEAGPRGRRPAPRPPRAGVAGALGVRRPRRRRPRLLVGGFWAA